MRYLSDVLKQRYGEKLYKLSLSSGCTCPNRDGSVGSGGCSFCSAGGSGEFASAAGDIGKQIGDAKERILKKASSKRFIAYFQSFTNTYGDARTLKGLYEPVVRRDDIAILSIGTRPDCLGNEILDMLASLNRVKPVWVELGLQTMHDTTAARLNRGYALPVFEEAVRNLKSVGIEVIVHVIFGLPGETGDDMLQTTAEQLTDITNRLNTYTLLPIMTPTGSYVMGEQYGREPFPLLSLEEYTDLVAESLRILPEQMVVHRMTGDGPGQLLIAPDWVRNKKKVLNTIQRKLRERTAGVRK